jgi:FkbM family methyltransferase
MRIFDSEIQRVTTRYGRLYVAAGDSVIGRSLQLYGEWAEDEIDSYSALLTDGDTIVDVGANIGTHSVALAARFPHSQVAAFEPQPLAFSLLASNVLAARTGNVYPRNCGCGERQTVLHVTPDYESIGWNIGAFSLRDADESNSGSVEILLVPLDSVAFRRRVQFIKIDVEGMEEAVLAGASKLIARDRPLIYFEVLDISRLATPRSLLMDLGYELRWLQSEAFNPNNFRLNSENIWRLGETGVLAVPSQNDARVRHLPAITGDETKVPVLEYAPS